MDTYLTLQTRGEAVYTEKRSKFYAFALPVADVEEVKTHVAAFRKRFYDARHVCFAYVIGGKGEQTRCNDDGEPSGTAGKPILGALRSAGVTFVLVVVVRYFGGIKLGTSGLVAAYRTAADMALTAAEITERTIKQTFCIQVSYAAADTAMRYIREAGGEITTRDYTATETLLTVNIRVSQYEALQARLSQILTLKIT